MSIRVRTQLAKEICDALGLKHVIELHLHFSVTAIATAEAKFFTEAEDGKKLPAIMKRYILLEEPDLKPESEP